MPKFDGFQMWRPPKRSAYFEVIESKLHSANGQKAGERRVEGAIEIDGAGCEGICSGIDEVNDA